MEAKGGKNILGWFFILFCSVSLFALLPLVCSLKSAGAAATTIMSEDRGGRRQKIKFFQHAGKAQMELDVGSVHIFEL